MQNRVNELLSLNEESMWNHCPGIENPADVGSRGEGAAKLKSNVLWWNGPPWLSEPMRNWPISEECSETIAEECCVEMKKGQAIEAVGEAVLLTTNGMPNMDTIIPITDFSSCDKLFRITTLVLRFVKKFKNQGQVAKGRNCLLGRGYCRRTWKCRSEVVKKCPERIEVPSKLQSVRARLLICTKTVVES